MASTVGNPDVTNFFSHDIKITLNGTHGRVPFYVVDSRSPGQPSPLFLFPQRIQLKEFRIQPLISFDPSASFVRIKLWVDGRSRVQHLITDAEGTENNNKLFNISNVDTFSPGGFTYVEIWGGGTDPGDFQEYNFQMWGTYIRT